MEITIPLTPKPIQAKEPPKLSYNSLTGIQKGSKSFHLASLFLSSKQKQDAWVLYTWCRLCDDAIDKAHSQAEAFKRLAELRRCLDWCWGSVPSDPDELRKDRSPDSCATETVASEPLRNFLITFQNCIMRLEIPKHLLSDLLDGMQMDVEGYSERCWQDLDRYCYGVAGTVGLMMCYVMGIRDERAFPYAIALGKAMQLTNIVRDFRSDLERGRCYVPIEWRHKNASFEAQKKDWPLFADRLIRLASEGYETGRRGIGFLPFRAGLAIQIASLVYEKIGEKILAQKEQAWETRCYTTKAEKLWIALRESLLWIFTYPRLRKNLFRSKLSPP